MSRWSIPKEWNWAKAVDIATIVGGGTPSTKNPANFAERGIAWITPADLSNYQAEYISRGSRDLSDEGYTSCGAQLMPKDTVLFTSRAPVGYCVLAANEICTNQGFKSLILKGGINPKFIRQYLLHSKDYAESLASGSTFKELSGARMASLEFPIPPLNEQKRIVAKIEELQSHTHQAREALETVPDLLEQLRQSILAAAFRGDLTRKWREQHKGQIEPATELLKRIRIERRKRWEAAELDKLKAKGLTGEKLDTQFAKGCKQYQEPETPNIKDLLNLPKEWCWVTLEIIAKIIDPNPSHRMPRYVEKGYPFISTENFVGFDKIDFSIGKKVPREVLEQQKRRFTIRNGDFVLSRIGTIGRIRTLPIGKDYCLSHALVLISPLSTDIIPQYIKLCLSAQSGLDQALNGVQSVGVPDLGMGKIRNFVIPIPPYEEQIEIVNKVESLFEVIEENYNKFEMAMIDLDNIDEAILSKAFQGELVPHDPNDEPASILLDQIRQEKERQTAEQKKTKPKQKGHKMKTKKSAQQDIIAILKEAARPMTPEELFATGGFGEDSVDSFYEQLRTALSTKKIRETRKGAKIKMEALS